MVQKINERLLEEIEEQHEKGYPIASLIELGREKGYVTLDDISTTLPESDLQSLDDPACWDGSDPQ